MSQALKLIGYIVLRGKEQLLFTPSSPESQPETYTFHQTPESSLTELEVFKTPQPVYGIFKGFNCCIVLHGDEDNPSTFYTGTGDLYTFRSLVNFLRNQQVKN